MQNCIIASTSTVHGSSHLEYLLEPLKKLWEGIDEILFIPYARPDGISHDAYTEIARNALSKLDKKVTGIHTYSNPITAIASAKALFTGGGNTFVLVKALHKNKLLTPLKKVIQSGIPYLGTSAGSVICGLTMQTTNDMPVVQPASYQTLGIVPFNINPHYLDPDPASTHQGETRAVRIQEYHTYNTAPVIGLREGSWLRITKKEIYLRGGLTARIFEQGKPPYELENGKTLSELN